MKGSRGPGGHQSHTRPIDIVDDSCLGALPTCSSDTKYRTINGQCNNLGHGKTLWGSMSIQFLRDVTVPSYHPKSLSYYLDPPGAVKRQQRGGGGHGGGDSGGPLPGCGPRSANLPAARLVSSVFHGDTNVMDTKATHMVTQFGQYLDHDIT
jgi:hypothetical protein